MTFKQNRVVPLAPIEDRTNYVNDKQLSSEEIETLNTMNRQFSHTTTGSKNVIISLRKNAINREVFCLEPISEFKNRFLHQTKVAKMNMGEAWLRWSGKNYYPNGLGYYPNKKLCPPTKFNMYLGLALKPQQGDVTPYLRHIEEVVCAGSKEVADYVMQYLAHMVQKPQEKPSVAIVMKSEQGAGKGTMMKPIEEIFGDNYTQTNGAYLVAGRFNSAICNRLIVFADEVDLTNKKIADKFKALISENTVFLEHKGLDPVALPNYMRFIFASNHEQVLLAGSRERRYLVLELSGHLAQDKDYFNQYHQWLDNNGSAYLLDYLINLDISNFDPRRAPVTQALKDEILFNLLLRDEYMLHELSLKKPFGALRATPDDIRVRFEDFLRKKNLPIMKTTQIGSMLGKLFKSYGIKATGKRGINYMYQFSETDILRQQFASKFGINPNDLF